VKQRYDDHQLSAVRLLEEIRPMGYSGSIVTLRRYLKALKGCLQRQRKVTVRFETPPGKQAQADWGDCGRFTLPDGNRLAVYVFVMVLAYSRMLFIQFTTSMKMGVLLECHQKAFAFFNGWPQTILYDNMKSVKRSRTQWNEQFLDFANHYGFVPKTHRPYRPRTKGKVERMVDYVKDNFLAGRCFEGVDDLNAQALHWLQETANVRVHGTTGRVPQQCWPEEKLIPYDSIAPYRYLDPVNRTVNYESMVHYRGSRYSVPPAYAGQRVHVMAQGGMITVACGDTVIAEHRQALKAGQCVVHKDHLAELWKLTEQQTRPTSSRRWEITLTQSVQQRPLTVFDEVAA
jgi:transposase